MGQIRVDLKVKGREGEELLRDVLVDTGATCSFLPKKILEKIGAFKYNFKTEVELGDGERVKAEVYGAIVRINDRESPTHIFTFKGTKSVVGAETLEMLGLKVDPTTGKLEETRPKGLAYFYYLSKLKL